MTFAIGFSELIKKADTDINQVGNAVVAANNSFNVACKEVTNKLVAKFASEGAKSDYSSPPFKGIHLKTNLADRAAVYPKAMQEVFHDFVERTGNFYGLTITLGETYENTKNFWVGASADHVRQTFITKVVPHFEQLVQLLNQIYKHGEEWLDEAVKYDATHGVQ